MGNAALTVPLSDTTVLPTPYIPSFNNGGQLQSGGSTGETSAPMFAGMSSGLNLGKGNGITSTLPTKLIQPSETKETAALQEASSEIEYVIHNATTVGENRLFIITKATCQSVLNSSVSESRPMAIKGTSIVGLSESSGGSMNQLDVLSQKDSKKSLNSSLPSSILTKSFKLSRRESNSIIESAAARLAALRSAVLPQTHPHLLPYNRISFGDPSNGIMPYIARQWIDRTLSARIKSPPQLLLVEQQWIVFQMICALCELHSSGIAHGSLSTSNFLITATSNLYLTDVGSYFKPYMFNVNSASTAVATFYETPTSWTTGNMSLLSCYIAPERFDCSALLPRISTFGNKRKNRISLSEPINEVGFLPATASMKTTKSLDSARLEPPLPSSPRRLQIIAQPQLISSAVNDGGLKHVCKSDHLFQSHQAEGATSTPSNKDENKQPPHIVASSHHAARGIPWIDYIYASDIFSLGCCIAELFCNGRKVLSFQDAVTLGISVSTQKRFHRDLDVRPHNFRFPSDMNLSQNQIVKNEGQEQEDQALWYLTHEMRHISHEGILKLIVAMCHPDPFRRPSASQCLTLAYELGLFCDGFYQLYLPLSGVLKHPLLQFPDNALIYLRETVNHLTPMKVRHRRSHSCRQRHPTAASKTRNFLKCRSDTLSPGSDADPSDYNKRKQDSFRAFSKRKISGAKTRLNPLLIFNTILSSVTSLPDWYIDVLDYYETSTRKHRAAKRSYRNRKLSRISSSHCCRSTSQHEVDDSYHSSQQNEEMKQLHGSLSQPATLKMKPEVEHQQSPVVTNISETKRDTKVKTKQKETLHQRPEGRKSRQWKLDYIYHFMSLWKRRREFLRASCGQLIKSEMVAEALPLPFFTPMAGKEYSHGLFKHWVKAFERCNNTVRQRAEIWPIGEHWGVFLWPERKSLDWSMKIGRDLVCALYNTKSTSLVHCLRTSRRSHSLQQNAEVLEKTSLVCLGSYIIPNLIDSKCPDIRCMGLQLLCEWGRLFLTHMDRSLCSSVIFSRIFPVLLELLENTNDNVRSEALLHLTHLCSRLSWNPATATFISDCLLQPFYSIGIDLNPRCRQAAVKSTPRLLRVPDCSSWIRSSLHNFLLPLLSSGAPEHRIAILKSCQSLAYLFPKKDILELVLPFLISFLNSSTPNVRVVFCLHAFDLIPQCGKRSETIAKQGSSNSTAKISTASELDLEGIMTVAAALVPCFEGALGDSDEMVVEVALIGLQDFFTNRLPTFPQLSFDHVFSPLVHGLASCVRRIARQLAVKVAQLLLHPNIGVVRAAEALIFSINEACFGKDIIATYVNLMNQFSNICPKNAIGNYSKLSDLMAHRFCPLGRWELYQLALSIAEEPEEFKRIKAMNDILRRRRALLPYICHAIKPGTLLQLSKLSSMQIGRQQFLIECQSDKYHSSTDLSSPVVLESKSTEHLSGCNGTPKGLRTVDMSRDSLDGLLSNSRSPIGEDRTNESIASKSNRNLALISLDEVCSGYSQSKQSISFPSDVPVTTEAVFRVNGSPKNNQYQFMEDNLITQKQYPSVKTPSAMELGIQSQQELNYYSGAGKGFPVTASNEMWPIWSVFARSELPIANELLDEYLGTPSIEDALFSNERLFVGAPHHHNGLVCRKCLRIAYNNHLYGLAPKHRRRLLPWNPDEVIINKERKVAKKRMLRQDSLSFQSWEFRDWRYRVLNIPEPDWEKENQFSCSSIPIHNAEQMQLTLHRNYSEGLNSVSSWPSLSQVQPLTTSTIAQTSSLHPIHNSMSLQQIGKVDGSRTTNRIAEELKDSFETFSVSQLPPQQLLLDHQRIFTNSTISRIPIQQASPLESNQFNFQQQRSCATSKSTIPMRVPMRNTSQDYEWRPRGVLAGTLYRHESAAKALPGRPLGFGITPDDRLLVSGFKHQGLSGRKNTGSSPATSLFNLSSSAIVPQSSTFHIWNCQAFEKNVEKAHVRSIEFSSDYVPTEFRILGETSSFLIGTQDGQIGSCPLEPSRGYTKVSNLLSQVPTGFSYWDGKMKHFGDPSIIGLDSLKTSLEQVIFSLHRGGDVGCWDFRSPNLSNQLALPKWMGYPSCFSIGANGHALHVGTIGGYLVTFDLRYRLMVQALKAKVAGRPVPILTSLSSDVTYPSTSIFVSLGSRRNEVCSVDPITGNIDWVFLSSHRSINSSVSRNKNNFGSLEGNKQGELVSEYPLLRDIPLSIFETVDLKLMTSAPRLSVYNGNDIRITLRNADMGGEGNITTLYRPEQLISDSLAMPMTSTAIDNKTTAGVSQSVASGILLTGGTDRRVRLLDLSRTCTQSYVVVGQQEFDSIVYSTVPVFQPPKILSGNNCVIDDIWKFIPVVTVEKIYSDSKAFSLKPRHFKRRKSISEQPNILLSQQSADHDVWLPSQQTSMCLEFSTSQNDVTNELTKCHSTPSTSLSIVTSPENLVSASQPVPSKFRYLEGSHPKAFAYPCSPSALHCVGRSATGGVSSDHSHSDSITALTVVANRSVSFMSDHNSPSTKTETQLFLDNSSFLITGGRDGLIKIWT